jgi:hypothetical protein
MGEVEHMKRRAFLLRSGAGLAAAALPGLAQPPGALKESVAAHHPGAAAASSPNAARHSIVHPGILQTRADLEFMKAKVKSGEEPWKSAWDRLQAEPSSSLDFKPKPFAHIIRGAYGAGQIGGAELTASASAANSHVLQWFVTGNEAYARKAIEIFDAWSATLVDFYENDAMLLAGWTGGEFANAAEILRATYPAWRGESLAQFKRMLLTVYVPLLRMFYPEANGNWDAAIMFTLLSIGIFCDDRKLMDEVYHHYRVGLVNSGITRYIYPSGQCEETCRDQGHVQLGLGYLARTSTIACNQGVDLFGEADNRLALGYEYTASLLLGEKVPVYGKIVDTRSRFSDIYEGVLQHFRSIKRMDLPYTEKAALRARDHSRGVLTFFRGVSTPVSLKPAPPPSKIAATAGAQPAPTVPAPADSIAVAPGESIQAALDKLKALGGGTVELASGLHALPATLRVPSKVTIAGAGIDCELFLDPAKTQYEAAMVNAEPDMHDVVLRDFVIEGAATPQASRDPNSDVQRRRTLHGPIRAGIIFLAESKTMQRNLRFEHLTVRNCIFSGVSIYGVDGLDVVNCDFSGNGGAVPPGPGKNHNLNLVHVSHVSVTGSRLCDSMFGDGIALSFGQDVAIRDCEIARNALDGVRIAESRKLIVEANLAEGNGGTGIVEQTWMEPNQEVVLRNNTLRNNANSG